MSDLTCPHCLGGVPHGAQVCRGCQAEVYYGLPKKIGTVILLAAGLSVLLGWKFSDSVAVAVILGKIALVGLTVAGMRIYAGHVEFKRPYRTRK